ncbi:hypothetical protein AB6A40_009591 [Gnathostoma spinigerum]|uniref:Uncharacterized protein n=1 Tax=Gnathostoma spinigerum TaxID=75299 RepID=A0ABD6F138_9BILA
MNVTYSVLSIVLVLLSTFVVVALAAYVLIRLMKTDKKGEPKNRPRRESEKMVHHDGRNDMHRANAAIKTSNRLTSNLVRLKGRSH